MSDNTKIKTGARLWFRHPKFKTLYNCYHFETWNKGFLTKTKGKLFIISDLHTPLELSNLTEREHYVLIDERRMNKNDMALK